MACTELFTLAPGGQSITKTITITAEQRPYVEDWYVAMKLPGEGMEEFVVRHFVTLALQYRNRLLSDNCEISTDTEIDVLQQDRDDYRVAIQAEARQVGEALLP